MVQEIRSKYLLMHLWGGSQCTLNLDIDLHECAFCYKMVPRSLNAAQSRPEAWIFWTSDEAKLPLPQVWKLCATDPIFNILEDQGSDRHLHFCEATYVGMQRIHYHGYM
jgi:hypothetical protein